jgi:hypothetical protein
VRLEELGKLKKSTSLGLDPATFQLVAQGLNHATACAKKTVSTIKHMLNKKTKEPICMTWKGDHVKGSQENHNSQQHHDQGAEEERNSPEKDRGLVDTQEGTDLQKDRCQELIHEVTTTVLSRRLRKPPATRRDDVLWMDISKIKP